MSETLCNQTVKPDTVNRSSPDTICHHPVTYSPSGSPACSGVSVLGSLHVPLQSVSAPQPSTDTSKSNDDIMQIMHQLISQDYHTNSTELGASPKHPSHFVINPAPDSQSANSPYLADIAVNSPSSDRPQYSPITPSQSPSGNEVNIYIDKRTDMIPIKYVGLPSYPDHMLYSLKQKKMITESDYLVRALYSVVNSIA